MKKLISSLFILTLLVSCNSARSVEESNPFFGEWKLDLTRSDPPLSTELNKSSPHSMRITALGNDGIRIEDHRAGTSCDGTFDGEEHECKGPNLPKGATMSLKRISPTEISYSVFDGIESGDRGSGTLTVSEDGLTLTQESQEEWLDKPLKAVYQKQL
jgi:hypothetical protein